MAIFVLLACLSAGQAQGKKAAKGIRSVDFRNLDHFFGMDEGGLQKLKIRNGKAKVGGGSEIYEIRKNDVVYGDMNGDGEEDAVVRIRLWTGASLRDFEILVYEYNSVTHGADVTARHVSSTERLQKERLLYGRRSQGCKRACDLRSIDRRQNPSRL